jgi:hypothetical protein
LHSRLLFQDQRYPAPPGLHHVDATQEFGHQGVAAFRDIALAELFDGQAVKQLAWIADLHAVLEDRHLHVIGIAICSVCELSNECGGPDFIKTSTGLGFRQYYSFRSR